MPSADRLHPSRREILGAAGGLFAWSFAPRFAFAASGRDPRLVVIVLRGGLDGLAAAPPIGDPSYAGLRDKIALPASGQGAALSLDGFFGLHPAMTNFARLYTKGEALVVHATATGYRQRSHFDGQDVLESGQPRAGLTRSGWLNRAMGLLPPGERISAKGALGVGVIAPLIVRGESSILGWAPQGLQQADEDLAMRVLQMYDEGEPQLAEALRQGLDTAQFAAASGMKDLRPGSGPSHPEGMVQIATGAAKLMAAPDGPRVAALALEGWDTHVNAGGATGQLATRLGGLDRAFAAFEKELGAVWRETVIVVITEFGRTVKENGNVGTDHGTATVALLAGGAVKGGRIVADWPGLKTSQLLDGRDLTPTTDLRAVLKGVLAEHIGLNASALSEHVFPGTSAIAALRGLIA
ncbi:MAG: DUF1501 domain-containing protein [Beijerinckiaceae bacterium]|nr:DUF1501 domain-containing protein [Beijerinckiaceae bacterium]